MLRTPRALTALAALALALTGCSSSSEDTDTPAPDDLPAAEQLLGEGAAAMSEVTTTHFSISATGEVAGLGLSKADGDLTRAGEAQGTATVAQFGTLLEMQFVIVGDTLHLKGPTGGFQKLPLAMAASVYDPSAILDPDRGAAKLLRTAKDATTEGVDDIDGHDAYRISFTPDKTALAALIPGNAEPGTSVVWLDTATKRISKIQFALLGADGAVAATVDVVFSDYDAPVTVSAP